MNPKENKMAAAPMGRLMFSMSLPLMVSLLVQSLYNIVDSIYVGRLSEVALTATSIAYPIQIMMVAVSVGTAVGLNAILSRLLGEGRRDDADNCATTGLFLGFVLGLLFMFAGVFFCDRIVAVFTDDSVTGEMCRQYLSICMIFCMGTFIEVITQRLLQATGNTFLSMVSLIVGAGTNIVLDPILIFGLLCFPAMGISGAAIATVIGQWLGAFVALLLNKYKNPGLGYKLKGWRLKKLDVLEIYKVGIPTIITQAMASIMTATMNIILMPLSASAVAFFGVYNRLQNFLFMPMNGLGQSLIPVVGFNYGARNGERIYRSLGIAFPAAVIIAAAGTIVFEIFPKELLTLFSAGEEMLSIGVPALRIISLTFIFASITVICGYAASGLGNGMINMIGTVTRQFALYVPLAYVFSKVWGISKTWYCSWISESAAVAICVFLMIRELKTKVPKTRSKKSGWEVKPKSD